jgi:voltage-gated potassium channel
MQNKNFFYVIISKLRQPIIALIVIYSFGILGMKIIPGTDNLGQEYMLSFFDAFYIVSYTSTTIGFGESPHPWNENQKMFMLIFIYSSVICWIWAINSIITILRDKEISKVREEYKTESKVKKIYKKFYIIAGIDETGHEVAKILTRHGFSVIAIDKDELKIDELRMYDYAEEVISFNGDINDIEVLKLCGIESAFCEGIIVSTGNDNTNWYTSAAAKILNKKLKIITIAIEKKTQEYLNSINIEHIVAPFEHFANELIQAINQPMYNMLRVQVTSETFDHYKEIEPKLGTWIIFGYEKIGEVLLKKLLDCGNDVILVDHKRSSEDICLKHNIKFIKGNNFINLKKLIDFSNVSGVISSYKDDLKNLSVIMGVRSTNEKIFTVVYENQLKNKELYEKLNIDLVVTKKEMTTRKIHYLVSEPLLGDFLNKMSLVSEVTCASVVNKLKSKYRNECLETWHVAINKYDALGVFEMLKRKRQIKLENLSSRDDVLALIIKRDDEFILLPKELQEIKEGDEILFTGSYKEYKKMMWLINHSNILEELM